MLFSHAESRNIFQVDKLLIQGGTVGLSRDCASLATETPHFTAEMSLRDRTFSLTHSPSFFCLRAWFTPKTFLQTIPRGALHPRL